MKRLDIAVGKRSSSDALPFCWIIAGRECSGTVPAQQCAWDGEAHVIGDVEHVPVEGLSILLESPADISRKMAPADFMRILREKGLPADG